MKKSLLLSGFAILLTVLSLSEIATHAQNQTEWRFFVAGEVKRPGQFDLGKQLTFRQAIALAEGITFKADPERTVIFRYDQTTNKRVEIKIDLKAVMNGQAEDIPLLSDDIIVVPNLKTKVVTKKPN